METSHQIHKPLFVRALAVLAVALLCGPLIVGPRLEAAAAYAPPTVVSVLDDFTSGPVYLVENRGQTTSQQKGTMVGGIRRTTVIVDDNPYDLNADVKVTGTGEVLVSADVRVYPVVQFGYGAHGVTGGRLGLDLSEAEAIRVNVGPNTGVLNVNVLLWSPDGWAQGHINVPSSRDAEDVILVFEDAEHFYRSEDFDITEVNSMLLQIQAPSTDYVLGDFSAVSL